MLRKVDRIATIFGYGPGSANREILSTLRRLGVGLILGGVCSMSSALAEEWSGYLGPRQDGTSSETALIESWGETGPKEKWRVAGGIGMSGIAIAEGKVVTLCQDETRQFAIALDLQTGQTLWKAELQAAYENQMGNGPRATPAIHQGQVFVYTGDGVLVALDLKSGEEQWRHAVVSELGATEADYGMASSPLVVGDRVIVTAGAADALLVAYETQTGNVAWTSGGDRAGYSSPVLRRLGAGADANEQVVAFSATAVSGFDPTSGDKLWTYDFETPYDCNIAAPVAIDGDLIISSGENHGSVRLKLSRESGTWMASEAWSSTGTRSSLRSEWQTPLQSHGYLYGFDNVGSAGPTTHFTCIDASTGERVWREERFGKGNAILADGKIFATTMEGDLVLIEASSEQYRELGRARVHGGTRQAPALSDGVLIVRDDAEIIAFEVSR